MTFLYLDVQEQGTCGSHIVEEYVDVVLSTKCVLVPLYMHGRGEVHANMSSVSLVPIMHLCGSHGNTLYLTSRHQSRPKYVSLLTLADHSLIVTMRVRSLLKLKN